MARPQSSIDLYGLVTQAKLFTWGREILRKSSPRQKARQTRILEEVLSALTEVLRMSQPKTDLNSIALHMGESPSRLIHLMLRNTQVARVRTELALPVEPWKVDPMWIVEARNEARHIEG